MSRKNKKQATLISASDILAEAEQLAAARGWTTEYALQVMETRASNCGDIRRSNCIIRLLESQMNISNAQTSELLGGGYKI